MRKEKESSPQSHTLLFGDFSKREEECSDGKSEGNVVKMSPFSHIQLLLAIFKREN